MNRIDLLLAKANTRQDLLEILEILEQLNELKCFYEKETNYWFERRNKYPNLTQESRIGCNDLFERNYSFWIQSQSAIDKVFLMIPETEISILAALL